MVLCCFPPNADETPRASPFHPPPPDNCRCAKTLLRWLLMLWNCLLIYVLVAFSEVDFFTTQYTLLKKSNCYAGQ